jgi:hypothetical protein
MGLKRMLRTIGKRYIVWSRTRSVGGSVYRDEARDSRRAYQRRIKSEVLDDLIRSWEIGEIKPPTDQERFDILNIGGRLSWKNLENLQKKYRGENI